jgi:hypothetical protein
MTRCAAYHHPRDTPTRVFQVAKAASQVGAQAAILRNARVTRYDLPA